MAWQATEEMHALSRLWWNKVIEGGSPLNIADVSSRDNLFNQSPYWWRSLRERVLKAPATHERTPDVGEGYANGTRSQEAVDTPAGTVRLEVPKTRIGHGVAPFYPHSPGAADGGSCRKLSCWPWRTMYSQRRLHRVTLRGGDARVRQLERTVVEPGQPRRQALGWGAWMPVRSSAAGRDPLPAASTLALWRKSERVAWCAIADDVALGDRHRAPTSNRRVLGVFLCASPDWPKCTGAPSWRP